MVLLPVGQRVALDARYRSMAEELLAAVRGGDVLRVAAVTNWRDGFVAAVAVLDPVFGERMQADNAEYLLRRLGSVGA